MGHEGLCRFLNHALRRAPFYFLINTNSLDETTIEDIRFGLSVILDECRKDPYSLEVMHYSVIAFGDGVQRILPLTEVHSDMGWLDKIERTFGSDSWFCGALKLASEGVEREVRFGNDYRKGDWVPKMFIFTGPTGFNVDECPSRIEKVKSQFRSPLILCVVGGDCDPNQMGLSKLSDTCFQVNKATKESFQEFIRWAFCVVWSDVEASIRSIP